MSLIAAYVMTLGVFTAMGAGIGCTLRFFSEIPNNDYDDFGGTYKGAAYYGMGLLGSATVLAGIVTFICEANNKQCQRWDYRAHLTAEDMLPREPGETDMELTARRAEHHENHRVDYDG